jgi:hypothetical protein
MEPYMISKNISIALALGVALAAAPRAVEAQISSTLIGVAEYDTDGTLLLLSGISAGPGGLGWKPRVGVQGYFLRYDVPAGDVDVTAIRPWVGMRNSFTGGSASINVGYAFTNRDRDFVTPAIIEDGGEGVVLSGGWDYWGTGNSFGYQLLGSYNFGSEALWTRARGTVPMQIRDNGQTRIGAEVAYLSGDNYYAFQPGAVLEFNNRGGRMFGLGAGMKFFKGGENAVYFKGEFTLPLSR